MYIKFCRTYEADAKTSDDSKTKLSGKPNDLTVELNEKSDSQILGNVRVYRRLCFLLSMICLVLLLIIIILRVQFPKESPVCPGEVTEKGTVVVKEDRLQSVCSLQDCMSQYPNQWGECASPVRRRPPCAAGWRLFEDSCYFLSVERLSWEESRQACQARGGDLAVITNSRVQSFLTQKGGLIYWIGLRFTSDKWTWVDNNALVKSYWTGEAQSRGDCCTLVGKAQPVRSWDVSPCNYSSYYICQTPKTQS